MTILSSTALSLILSSASVNTFNQILESPMDAKTNITRNRPIVQESISKGHATTFDIISGPFVIDILYVIVNPITSYISFIKFLTYVLYIFKWISIINTWIGSL
ncbi:uncharacterized protein MELLADRAFT_87388 [Melampsora larici-populina 98AG31]|uniref:Heme O synthase n=1 Tax=Melampsora larici-populina (strain 98AG31 / pathotype 3-4-7) TaxID=747676 RepID=F4RN46_MELLP|nr:uncharacterized protein MELLADRAFT_87388 [Melampsora larici-populina 98AG31]EGG06236.1 hypothetical protein MELLADRAFT_87388 [Melampsora larici-populina 98AG31]